MTENKDTPVKVDTMKNSKQWLQHCVEVETNPEHCGKSQEVHKAAADAIIADNANSITGNIVITSRTLSNDELFDFNSVHLLPLPIEVETCPLVLEAIYKADSSKYFVRIKSDLNVYDGVSALHAGLNLIEYLETESTISPYPFTESNPPLPENQFQNFEAQLKRLGEAKAEYEAKKSADPEYYKTFRRTPFSGADYENMFESRSALRFTEVNISFPEILDRIEKAKKLLDLPFYAATINYSPSVALSFCSSIDEFRNRDKKIANICLPPVGTGPPPPMDNMHVEMLFNAIFLNSYGKHAAPKTSAKVVGYVWDWRGFLPTFSPFFQVCQIQDKLFFSASASPPEMDAMIEAGIFKDVGVSQTFQGCPFYDPAKAN